MILYNFTNRLSVNYFGKKRKKMAIKVHQHYNQIFRLLRTFSYHKVIVAYRSSDEKERKKKKTKPTCLPTKNMRVPRRKYSDRIQCKSEINGFVWTNNGCQLIHLNGFWMSFFFRSFYFSSPSISSALFDSFDYFAMAKYWTRAERKKNSNFEAMVKHWLGVCVCACFH